MRALFSISLHLLAGLAHFGNVSKLSLRLSLSRFTSPAPRNQLIYFFIEVETQLLLDISLDITAEETEIPTPHRSVSHKVISLKHTSSRPEPRSFIARRSGETPVFSLSIRQAIYHPAKNASRTLLR
jgi:hypothetical protein